MRIFITGQAGTWGREFTKQLLEEGHEVSGIDNTEKAVAEFRHDFPDVKIEMADFGDYRFQKNQYDLLIHLAAYKHIDLAELNVSSCIENNVTKTAILFDRAHEAKIPFMFVSTDKAVEPQSVYGMTKALGERLTKEKGQVLVRSGNIIGSNGSVLHIWRECVQNKKPICVTDLNMKRYFIPVKDAVAHVWQEFKKGKKFIVVDIGGLRTLKEIINEILKEFDFTFETYPHGTEVIGKRPGERLVDDILWDYETKE